MGKALGMIEFKTVSAGVTAADAMVKTAAVELVEAQTVCPGKYIALITGDLSAVDAAVETAKVRYGENLIDSFVLGNPHEGIFPAIYGTTHVEHISSLGILETFDAAAIIVAADGGQDGGCGADRAADRQRHVRKILCVPVRRGIRCGGCHFESENQCVRKGHVP